MDKHTPEPWGLHAVRCDLMPIAVLSRQSRWWLSSKMSNAMAMGNKLLKLAMERSEKRRAA